MLYNSLNDVLPQSSFVMSNDAEHQEGPPRPLSATEGNSSTILSEQEINHTEAQATGESLRPPFAMEGTGRAMLSKQEIDDIETATVGYSQNEAWQTYKKGRITASNFYRVFTKVETMKKSHKIKCLETRAQKTS